MLKNCSYLPVIVLLLLVSIIACGSDDTPPPTAPMTGSVDEANIIGNILSTCEGIRTYRYEMQVSMDMSLNGETEDIEMDTVGIIDNVNKITKMTMELPSEFGVPSGIQMEAYLRDDNMMYIKGDYPDIGELWIKEDTGEGYWESQNIHIVQMELLKDCGRITGLKEFNGVSCYVVDMDGSREKMTELMVAQAGVDDLFVEEVDLQDAVESVSTRFWYSEETLLPIGGEMEMAMAIKASALGIPFGGQSDVTYDIEVDFAFSDYNEVGEIELPAEAKDAIDASVLE